MIARRSFIRLVAGIAATIPSRVPYASADPPPETVTLRLIKGTSMCWAPQYIAEELLRAEGFTDIAYVDQGATGRVPTLMANAEADLSMNFVGPNLIAADQGHPVVFLAGAHVGCFEVFGGNRVRRVADLKGKTVAVSAPQGTEYIFLAAIAAYVGLDPRKDLTWAVHKPDEGLRLFSEGKVDAYIGFPPRPQELRAKNIGHVIVNSAVDRPWSQYFCCLFTGRREFIRKNPVATKRALRALLKAVDLCGVEPERVGQLLVERKWTPRVDYAVQLMKELPYGKWREFDPEDTLRFYALRLHEAGLVKARPQKLISDAADWRFLNELKRELKG